jgi:hypothetical protein
MRARGAAASVLPSKAAPMSSSTTGAATPLPPGLPRLRVVAWNLDGLEPARLAERTREAVRLVVESRADVALFQEVVGETLPAMRSLLAKAGYAVVAAEGEHMAGGGWSGGVGGAAAASSRADRAYFCAAAFRTARVPVIHDLLVADFPRSSMQRHVLSVLVSVRVEEEGRGEGAGGGGEGAGVRAAPWSALSSSSSGAGAMPAAPPSDASSSSGGGGGGGVFPALFMTSHFESLTNFAEERVNQMRAVLRAIERGRAPGSGKGGEGEGDVIGSAAPPAPHFVLFAGDTNLREKEVPVPLSSSATSRPSPPIVDAWEACGGHPDTRWTFDCLRNDNKPMQGLSFKPRCRYDRMWARNCAPPQGSSAAAAASSVTLTPTAFRLLGTARMPSSAGGMFPSDHFGVCVDYAVQGRGVPEEVVAERGVKGAAAVGGTGAGASGQGAAGTGGGEGGTRLGGAGGGRGASRLLAAFPSKAEGGVAAAAASTDDKDGEDDDEVEILGATTTSTSASSYGAAAVTAASSSMSWACAACTYENLEGGTECEVCGTRR